MANQQHINPADVKKSAEDLHVFANGLTARLKKIKGEVETAASVYKGVGSIAFQQAMAQWDSTAVAIRRDVFELAAVVRAAGTEHVAGDQRGEAAFKRVYKGLGG